MPTRLIPIPELTELELTMLKGILGQIHLRMHRVKSDRYCFADCEFVFGKAEGMDRAFYRLFYKIDGVRVPAKVEE